MKLRVYRGAGDKPGADVSDPLLCHRDAIRARGTHEIDAAATAVEVSAESFFAGRLPRPGELLDLVDEKGRTRRGILDSCEIVLTRSDLTTFTADCNLVIEADTEEA